VALETMAYQRLVLKKTNAQDMKTSNLYAQTESRPWVATVAPAALLILALALSGCGTISGFKPKPDKTTGDLSHFNKVCVEDFTDGASQKASSTKLEKKHHEMERVTRDFADMLAWEIDRKCIFDQVTRNGTNDNQTLIVRGTITRYEEGSPSARLWVGMGAGSSYFDASVEFRDGGSGEPLGSLDANRTSWVLGGGLAAAETPDTFMREAARKVATELARLKGARAVSLSSEHK
jgi:hypothetical protein